MTNEDRDLLDSILVPLNWMYLPATKRIGPWNTAADKRHPEIENLMDLAGFELTRDPAWTNAHIYNIRRK